MKSEFKVSLSTKDFSPALKKYGEIEPYYQSLMEKLRSGEALTSARDFNYFKKMREAELHKYH